LRDGFGAFRSSRYTAGKDMYWAREERSELRRGGDEHLLVELRRGNGSDGGGNKAEVADGRERRVVEEVIEDLERKVIEKGGRRKGGTGR
jgi:hypothetical protein